jgi:hypothetical protein
MMSPPCETWSVSRGQPYTIDGKTVQGPPKLRNYQYPHGLPHLTNKQHEQTITGSKLLYNTLQILLALMRTGAIAIIEHPANPTWHPQQSELCSIWKLPIFQILLTIPYNRLTTFNQSIHGQVTLKPTTFFTTRITTTTIRKHLFRRHSTCHSPEKTQPFTIGTTKDSAGKTTFNTAKLKEYPPSLNKAIALIILDSISEHRQFSNHTLTDNDSPETYKHLFEIFKQHFDEYTEQTREIGHDFWHESTKRS